MSVLFSQLHQFIHEGSPLFISMHKNLKNRPGARAARHLLQFPPLPSVTNLPKPILPPLPSIPTLPQPTLPSLPTFCLHFLEAVWDGGCTARVKPRLSQSLTRGARPDSNSRPSWLTISPTHHWMAKEAGIGNFIGDELDDGITN
uniref:Uncharacterized protein n=1 Tax=Salix viminalis TaxID=40686 RepID=A0A6N2MGF0_SALVM